MAWPWDKKLKISNARRVVVKQTTAQKLTKSVKKTKPSLLPNISPSKLQNKLETSQSWIKKLSRDFDLHRDDVFDEIKAVNKSIGAVYDKEAHHDKEIKDLKVVDNKLLSEIDTIERKVKSVKDIVANIEREFNADTIKKFKQTLDDFSSTFKLLEAKDLQLLTTLQRVDKRLAGIEKHSGQIDAEREEIKETSEKLTQNAQELKDTVNNYAEQMLELSNKVSANISKTADINEQVNAMLSRIETAEGQTAALNQLAKALEQNSRLLAELAKRVDYLEKTTVRTVVLD